MAKTRDKRPVDELTVEELERILAIRKREARQARLRHLEEEGRRLPIEPVPVVPPPPSLPPQQHEAARHVPPVEPPVTYDLTDDVPRFEDDLGDDLQPRPLKKPKTQPPAGSPSVSRRRQLWDRALLGVEILGLVGIVVVLVVGGYLIISENDKIEALEQKSAAIQQEAEALRPTPSPQPELRVRLSDYVLPGGHFYNDGIGTFNLEELPESLRPVAAAQINSAPQVPLVEERTAYSPTRIVIPKINVDASIYGGDDWYSLQRGVGHLSGSANPGERGNMVLTAHNDIYGEIFRYIEQLEPGDEIRVEASGRWYTYVVREKQVVNPTDVWVLKPTNEPVATLITCYPYRVDNKRMVVFADLQE